MLSNLGKRLCMVVSKTDRVTFMSINLFTDDSCPSTFYIDGNPLGSDSYTRINYSKSCLGFVENQQNKYGAEHHCKGNGGGVVEIDSADLQNFTVSQILKKVSSGDLSRAYWWIGATEVTSERNWIWTDGMNSFIISALLWQ